LPGSCRSSKRCWLGPSTPTEWPTRSTTSFAQKRYSISARKPRMTNSAGQRSRCETCVRVWPFQELPMWLITNFGFFSVVEKPGDNDAGRLTVRARVKGDLETLRDRYLPEMGEITANAGTDYKYRAQVPRSAMARASAQIIDDIDYSNFKSSV